MSQQTSYFYVLYCRDNTLYGGYTTNIKRRLKQHNDGTGAKYTRMKSKRPVKMLYAEKYSSKSEAMKAEYAFKQLTRKQKERYLVNEDVVYPFDRRRKTIMKDKRVNTDE
ncbi:MAG TPA: GIY-YIG nuclease family protein [Alloiococcus sp.]|nr:GIY-YIG nuclease family protein [Alloiococcus sp.]